MKICPRCHYEGDALQCPHDGLPLVDPSGDESLDPGPSNDLTGQTFEGKYKVDAHVGSGGMGAVWGAHHVLTQQRVVLKVMRRSVGQEARSAQRFFNEALACSRLTHPNTVRILDFGATAEGDLFIVMEWVPGRALSTIIRDEGPLSIRRALRIAWQICQSLDEAHAQGVVHRDLKPSNILVADVHRRRDFVKVIDFGIAKLTGDVPDGKLTATGASVGTPLYMAPEQILCRPIDARTDLYAVGVLLFEMLAGRPPFVGNAVIQVLSAHVRDAPPPLPAEVRGERVPAELHELVAELLQKEAAARPPSAGALEERIQRVEALVRGYTPDQVTPDGPTGSATPWGTLGGQDAALTDPDVNPLGARFDGADRRTTHGMGMRGRLLLAISGLLLASTLVALVALGVGRRGAPETAASGSGSAGKVVTDVRVAPLERVMPDASPTVAAVAAVPPEPEPAPAVDVSVPKLQVVRVRSDPAGATVLAGGKELGITPLDLELREGERKDVALRHPGYREKVLVLGPDSGAEIEVPLVRRATRDGTRRPPKPAYRPTVR